MDDDALPSWKTLQNKKTNKKINKKEKKP